MQFFYVLVDGDTWKKASKSIKNTPTFKSTLNRKYNEWNNNKIFKNVHESILDEYMKTHEIKEAYIDSTDLKNENCERIYTSKSLKLSKQAIKLTFISDQNQVPISKPLLDKPHVHDSKRTIDAIMTLNINNEKQTILGGDKAYILNKSVRNALLKSNGIRLVTPKKEYKKKEYKTKNYNRKISRIRHSKQMKLVLKHRITIEHTNNLIHRSFKRLDKVYDKSYTTLLGFIYIAFATIALWKS